MMQMVVTSSERDDMTERPMENERSSSDTVFKGLVEALRDAWAFDWQDSLATSIAEPYTRRIAESVARPLIPDTSLGFPGRPESPSLPEPPEPQVSNDPVYRVVVERAEAADDALAMMRESLSKADKSIAELQAMNESLRASNEQAKADAEEARILSLKAHKVATVSAAAAAVSALAAICSALVAAWATFF